MEFSTHNWATTSDTIREGLISDPKPSKKSCNVVGYLTERGHCARLPELGL